MKELIVTGNKCENLNISSGTYNIELKDNATLLIDTFDLYEKNEKINLNIKVTNNTVLDFNFSYITYEEVIININIDVLGNNNNVSVNIKSISKEKGFSKITVNGIVHEKTKANILSENIKIIGNNSKNVIIPNVIVNSNDVNATHGATIGMLRNDELIYFMKKGLSKEKSIKLIEYGFLTNILKDTKTKERIKEIIDNGR